MMLLPHLLLTNVICLFYAAEPCIKFGTTEHCYKVVDTNITWNEASSICKGDGGHLLIIELAEEQNFIADEMAKRKFTVNGLWLGSNNLHPEAQRTWANGNKFTYQNWGIGEPSGTQAEAYENCAEISTNNKKWKVTTCSDKRGYICENTTRAEPCIKDEISGHCYQILDTNTIWNQAFKFCKSGGGNLATIESAEEQQFIADLIRKRSFKAVGLWIGSNKLHPEQQRTWANGEPFNYVNWAKGEPSSLLVDENCAEIYAADGTWNDVVCTERRHYICENSLNLSSDAANAYIQVNTTGHWYKLGATWTTWAEAFNICIGDGGTLMIIETAEEQTFISQIMKIRSIVGSLWIGSNKLYPEKTRTWTNGESFAYANWAKGEPNNNSPKVENCAEIYTSDSLWNDRECNSLRGFICEKTLPPVTPGSSQRQVFVISIAVGSSLVLIVGLLLLYYLIQKRKKYKQKDDQVYPGLQVMEMTEEENAYNRISDRRDTYCTIDDNFSAPNDLTDRKDIY